MQKRTSQVRTSHVAMTAKQAHRELGGSKVISLNGFYQAISRHEVPSVRLGKRIIIPRAAFYKWLEESGTRLAG